MGGGSSGRGREQRWEGALSPQGSPRPQRNHWSRFWWEICPKHSPQASSCHQCCPLLALGTLLTYLRVAHKATCPTPSPCKRDHIRLLLSLTAPGEPLGSDHSTCTSPPPVPCGLPFHSHSSTTIACRPVPAHRSSLRALHGKRGSPCTGLSEGPLLQGLWAGRRPRQARNAMQEEGGRCCQEIRVPHRPPFE